MGGFVLVRFPDLFLDTLLHLSQNWNSFCLTVRRPARMDLIESYVSHVD